MTNQQKVRTKGMKPRNLFRWLSLKLRNSISTYHYTNVTNPGTHILPCQLTSWYFGIPPLTAPLITPWSLIDRCRKHCPGSVAAFEALVLSSLFIIWTVSSAVCTGHRWNTFREETSYHRKIPGSLYVLFITVRSKQRLWDVESDVTIAEMFVSV